MAIRTVCSWIEGMLPGAMQRLSMRADLYCPLVLYHVVGMLAVSVMSVNPFAVHRWAMAKVSLAAAFFHGTPPDGGTAGAEASAGRADREVDRCRGAIDSILESRWAAPRFAGSCKVPSRRVVSPRRDVFHGNWSGSPPANRVSMEFPGNKQWRLPQDPMSILDPLPATKRNLRPVLACGALCRRTHWWPAQGRYP